MRDGLSDGNILIRPFSDADIPAVYEAVRESIAELSRWMPWCHEDYSIEETRAFIMSREEARNTEAEYSFGIFDVRTGKFLGAVGINQINRIHGYANLGYWVRTSATGRGVASSAARLATRFGLEEAGLHRVEILAALENRASQRAAEKARAVREGVLRKRLLIKGEAWDAVLYSLVAEDFQEQ
ncbi:MAG TPA: GNAT family N-acetyltransferase [Pyrinomonadaceae bacterium]